MGAIFSIPRGISGVQGGPADDFPAQVTPLKWPLCCCCWDRAGEEKFGFFPSFLLKKKGIFASCFSSEQMKPEVGATPVQVGHNGGGMGLELSPPRGQHEAHFVLPPSFWMRNSSLAPRNLPKKKKKMGKTSLKRFVCSGRICPGVEIPLSADKMQLPVFFSQPFPGFFK